MSFIRYSGVNGAATVAEGDQVVVTPTGQVSSEASGIMFSDNGSVTLTTQIRVDGYVFGYSEGLFHGADVAVTVGQGGTLAGGSSGISGNGTLNLVNYGTVSGNASIFHFDAATVMNHGTIAGDIYFTFLFDNTFVQSVANDGKIVGDIYFGGGADSYTASGSGSVTGMIYGGAGDDTFTIGRAEEQIEGGDGNDRIIVAGTQGVTIDLKTMANTGVGAGDSYEGIESLYGSSRGDDVLRGSALADSLYGRGGDDSLKGAEGSDKLSGGTGTDTMAGQSGNDSFQFRSTAEGGDLIVDFALFGDNDRITIDKAGFELDLATGTLASTNFRTNTTGLAGDANDRFIYKTTDNTVWFDHDGVGGDKAVMIADLQAGATFTAADIVIF